MNININEQKLSDFYNRAKKKYYECLKDRDNNFLKEELSMPIEQVELRHDSIKIVFSQDVEKKHLIEISLTLWDGFAKSIGKYIYIEDDQQNAVEDSLVFY